MIKRDETKSDADHTFNLGPMLPNMEKDYWFFIDSDLVQKAKAGKESIFISLYFEYKFAESTSGYGMISQFEPNSTDLYTKTCGLTSHSHQNEKSDLHFQASTGIELVQLKNAALAR